MEEFTFIESIKQSFYRQSSLVRGVGDDAAVFRQTSQDIVTAMDTFVEGVHFTKDTMSPSEIGWRVLAANLSDLAAMGAAPAFYLVSVVIPETWSEEELRGIFEGMKHLASRYNADLIGGDTVSGAEFSVTVTVIGYADRDKVRYRSAAKAGDVVFVTGNLGDSAAGLHMLQNPDEYEYADYFKERHVRPEARIDFAQELKGIKRVALNDVSDGIANEASEIAYASQVSIHLLHDAVPRHPGLAQFIRSQIDQWVYFGGEDFELLGTVSRTEWPDVQKAGKATGLAVTEIGYVREEQPGSVFLREQGHVRVLKKDGYQHMK
ncbi:Thiamine-phosphate kinase [Lentibacillus sp. JNUCC-1]|uniref:thiamine-phosphate kinase n=1 Tax=Lentibacillus sp. JNUCC-1 TaxID=2654513 RepID=UPI0012E71600|nr:thiamine-phosphate kinase [Lentibacillus sp. JNUCC-1]MUV38514.1 Thiamine-phosphate kinase [Lentibacillus sp. JNUCC-1]